MVGVREGKICPSLPIFLKTLQTHSKGGVLGTEVKNAKKYSLIVKRNGKYVELTQFRPNH